MKKQKIFLITAGVFCLLCGAAPLIYSVFNAGCIIMLALGVGLCALAALWMQISKRRRLYRFVNFCLFIGVSIITVFSCMIAYRAWFCLPPEQDGQTLIVLGARVYESGPSRMLKYRLDKALRHLNEYPSSTCIVSGGQGDDEPCTEASAMAAYLVANGIAAERIMQEDLSTNTNENISFSAKHIPVNSTGIIIVTNDFHQMRASVYARNNGFPVTYALSAFTPPGLLPIYWMREVGGIPYSLLTGR